MWGEQAEGVSGQFRLSLGGGAEMAGGQFNGIVGRSQEWFLNVCLERQKSCRCCLSTEEWQLWLVGAGLSWGVKWVGCDQEFCFGVKLEISMRSPILSR